MADAKTMIIEGYSFQYLPHKDFTEGDIACWETIGSDLMFERMAQVRKFGQQNDKSIGYWYAMLGEEYGEVGNALNEYLGKVEVIKKLRKTATVCLAMIDLIMKGGLDVENI